MKKILLSTLLLAVLFTPNVVQTVNNENSNIQALVAEEVTKTVNEDVTEVVTYTDVMQSYYDEVALYASENGKSFDVSFEEFHDYFYEKDMLFTDYVDEMKVLIDGENDVDKNDVHSIKRCSSNNSAPWYQNIGTTLPKAAKYGSYNYLSTSCGYILYEAAGGGGVTGHVAIFEGKYIDHTYGFYYRVIESTYGIGVCRSAFDDNRFISRKGTIYTVTGWSATTRAGAVRFAVGQLGKPYSTAFTTKDRSASTKSWYCSELVYAAYWSQGLDIERRSNGSYGGPGVWPSDIVRAARTVAYVSY